MTDAEIGALVRRMHPVYQTAWFAAPEVARPREVHLGGPAPELPGAELVRVALFCVESVAPVASEYERIETEAIRKRVLAFLDRPSATAAAKLKKDAWVQLGNSPLTVARHAAKAAWDLHRKYHSSVSQTVGHAAMRAAGVLRETNEPDRVRTFLQRLDAELLRLDAGARVPDEEVRRVVWIGLRGGRPDHFLLELEGGGFGLVSKVKSRWRFHKGAKDEVLATVPDDLFPGAVRAASLA